MSAAGKLLLLLLSVGLLATGAIAAVMELRPLSISAATPEERFAVLSQPEAGSGLSYQGRRALMIECLSFNESRYMLAQPTAKRRALQKGCLTSAQRFVAAMPSFSEAWLVEAAMLAEQPDVAGFVVAAEKSWQSAPFVEWLALQRLRLREAERSHVVDPVLLASLDRQQAGDIVTLMRSDGSAAALARQYIADPGFRDRMTAAAEQAPAMDQRRLLRMLAASGK